MQLRFCICIPVYNHPKTIVEIIDLCLLNTDHDIIVIDDGSEIPVENLYKEKKQFVQNQRLFFIRQSKNQGKGFAIQTAVQETVRRGYTHLITIDADGQHLPEEIIKLTTAAEINPWAVILGDRQMQTENVPKSSVFGKAFSNFWIKYQTDQKVCDSQSGFRIYPLFYLQTMTFLTKRYDFEIEILTRLIWKNIEIKPVPITVRYFASVDRVTHFHKFRDNLRLTILNTILVSVSLLKRADSPFKSALATSIGVFVGCLPFYGLHTLIVALFAFLFRMNFIYLWLGTQISIPPLVPFIIAGSHFASRTYLGHPPTGFFGLSSDWLIGISLFASIASIVIGFCVYIFKNNLRKKNTEISEQNLKTSSKNIAVKSSNGPGIIFMRFALKKFGLKTAYFFLYFIVPYYYLFSIKARKSASEYWVVVHPEINFFHKQIKILKQLYVFAQVLVDRAYQKLTDQARFQVVNGDGVQEFIDHIKNSKKGQIILQSHLGGWEMAMSYFQKSKSEKKMMAVMYGIKDSYEHSSIRRNDESLEIVQFNFRQDTIMNLKSYLDKGHVVGLMGDRPVGRSFELIPFMGKLALFDSSAIRLAILCQADITYIFCLKNDNHTSYFLNTIRSSGFSESLTKEQKILQILYEYSNHLERHLRLHPEQWFNFFPFWSEKLF